MSQLNSKHISTSPKYFNTYMTYEQNRWKSWLLTRYKTRPHHYMRLHKWVALLVKRGIVPSLIQSNYAPLTDNNAFIDYILNCIYRFEFSQHTYKNETIYVHQNIAVKHWRTTPEQDEHFYIRTFPERFWDEMRHWIHIQKYADDSEFSQKLWACIPHWVYRYSELIVSSDSENDDISQSDDGDDTFDPHNEVDVDPYIKDNTET